MVIDYLSIFVKLNESISKIGRLQSIRKKAYHIYIVKNFVFFPKSFSKFLFF